MVHLLFLKNPLCEFYDVKLLSNLILFRGRGDWSGGPRGGGRGGPPGEVFQNVLETLENGYFVSEICKILMRSNFQVRGGYRGGGRGS